MFEERPSGICPTMNKNYFEELRNYQSPFFRYMPKTCVLMTDHFCEALWENNMSGKGQY